MARGTQRAREHHALSNELGGPESVLSDVIMTWSRVHERALFGPIETRLKSVGAIRATLARATRAPSPLRAGLSTDVQCSRSAACTYGTFSGDYHFIDGKSVAKSNTDSCHSLAQATSSNYYNGAGGRYPAFTHVHRGSGGVVVRLLASHLGEPGSISGGVAPGFPHVGIMRDDAAGYLGNVKRKLQNLSLSTKYHVEIIGEIGEVKRRKPWNTEMAASGVEPVSSQVRFLRFITEPSRSARRHWGNFRPARCEFVSEAVWHVQSWTFWGRGGRAVNVLASHQSEPDFRMWESCRTMPLVHGFSRVSPVLSFRRCSILTSFYPYRLSKASLLRAAQISSLTHSIFWKVSLFLLLYDHFCAASNAHVEHGLTTATEAATLTWLRRGPSACACLAGMSGHWRTATTPPPLWNNQQAMTSAPTFLPPLPAEPPQHLSLEIRRSTDIVQSSLDPAYQHALAAGTTLKENSASPDRKENSQEQRIPRTYKKEATDKVNIHKRLQFANSYVAKSTEF
ncbi:hypothetical protein PR048_017828 [Dryococelus australis]|uniref:Uncharacterized protein n=1 Tax=Dryococelus australis TaxID=614101 RepID=A0ABQ9HAQ1_9NEOP|nr:hypothetical protein PR048_017828 [Dryococelus australis]